MSIIAHGKAVHTSLEVAQTLEEKHNVSVEVLDLRSIRPLDVDAIIKTVKKTNRVLLVEEINHFAGLMLSLLLLFRIKHLITWTHPSKEFQRLMLHRLTARLLKIFKSLPMIESWLKLWN
jgi:pyruvate/2-oxoglutarate/acetoin dehydrogenase E1 component